MARAQSWAECGRFLKCQYPAFSKLLRDEGIERTWHARRAVPTSCQRDRWVITGVWSTNAKIDVNKNRSKGKRKKSRKRRERRQSTHITYALSSQSLSSSPRSRTLPTAGLEPSSSAKAPSNESNASTRAGPSSRNGGELRNMACVYYFLRGR